MAAPAEPIATSWAQPRASEARWEFPPWGRLAYVDGVRAIAILAVIGFHARHAGLPRRLCRRRCVLRDLRFPDHPPDRDPATDRAFLGDGLLRAADSAHLPAAAPRDRGTLALASAVSAAAAGEPRTGEVGSRDRRDDLELFLLGERGLFCAAGRDQSAAAHLVARRRGAILPAGARRCHGRALWLGGAPQLGREARAACRRPDRHLRFPTSRWQSSAATTAASPSSRS